MTIEQFLKRRDELLSIAENEKNHFLNRVSAYLELAIHEKDRFYATKYVRIAKDLIDKH